MIRLTMAALGLLLGASLTATAGEYRLNPGDVLEISVWKEEALQREVLVLPDGTLAFPLAGHVDAAGKTPSQIQGQVAARLEEYIPDPVVTVSVRSVSGNKVYVIGKVANPGAYVMAGPLDVMQALSLAGGLVTFADEDGIRVLRRNGEAQTAIPFAYNDVKRGRGLESNIVLERGDIVVVP